MRLLQRRHITINRVFQAHLVGGCRSLDNCPINSSTKEMVTGGGRGNSNPQSHEAQRFSRPPQRTSVR